MKKIFSLLLILFLLTSCSNPFVKNTKVPDKEYKISDYYPFKENVRMKYAGIGMEYAEQDVYVDLLEGNRLQQRIINPGTTQVQILENANGELRLITSEGEFYFYKSLMSSSNSNPELILKEPLVEGTKWTLPDGRNRYISSMDMNISTPTGSYTVMEVTTEGNDYRMYDYYALNIGLVKRIFKSGESTIETTLEKIENNATMDLNLTLYYPNYKSEEISYIKVNEKIKTNENIIAIFEKYFKDSSIEALSPLMSKNTKIKKLDIDLKNRIAKIDFSREFVDEMNAGSGLELLILQSVSNTICSYYSVDEVIITLEGEPYTSGHIQLNRDEGYPANFMDASEYK